MRRRRRSATRGQCTLRPDAPTLLKNLSLPSNQVEWKRTPRTIDRCEQVPASRTSAAERRIHVGDVAPRLAVSALSDPTPRPFSKISPSYLLGRSIVRGRSCASSAIDKRVPNARSHRRCLIHLSCQTKTIRFQTESSATRFNYLPLTNSTSDWGGIG